MVSDYYRRVYELTRRSLKTLVFLSSIASLLDGLGMGLCLVLFKRITEIEPNIHTWKNFEMCSSKLREHCPKASFVPEIWPGHKIAGTS